MTSDRNERGDGRRHIAASRQPEGGSPARPMALLVDDHPDVLVGVGAYLTGAGFDVTKAGTGDEALYCLMSNVEFALLVTDYAMPGMTGVDLARQALEQNPALKVMIITGFPSDAGLFDRPSSVALLAKPFRRSAFIEVVQKLFAAPRLDSPAPG
jgi:CheY-like chemotaxis protein